MQMRFLLQDERAVLSGGNPILDVIFPPGPQSVAVTPSRVRAVQCRDRDVCGVRALAAKSPARRRIDTRLIRLVGEIHCSGRGAA